MESALQSAHRTYLGHYRPLCAHPPPAICRLCPHYVRVPFAVADNSYAWHVPNSRVGLYATCSKRRKRSAKRVRGDMERLCKTNPGFPSSVKITGIINKIS